MTRFFVGFVGFFALSSCDTASIPYPTARAFEAEAEVGQVYSCLYENAGVAFAFKIGRIEDDNEFGRVFHVQIAPVSPAGMPGIGHAPFLAQSFDQCLLDPEIEPLLAVPFDDVAFEQGYETWKDQEGGVFDIPVLNAVVTTIGALGAGGQR